MEMLFKQYNIRRMKIIIVFILSFFLKKIKTNYAGEWFPHSFYQKLPKPMFTLMWHKDFLAILTPWVGSGKYTPIFPYKCIPVYKNSITWYQAEIFLTSNQVFTNFYPTPFKSMSIMLWMLWNSLVCVIGAKVHLP